MKVYQGKYLSILYEKENNRFVQNWISSPKDIEDFKSEMLRYVSFFKKHKPSQVLWLQQNMTISLDTNIQKWIEQNVNIPLLKVGSVSVNKDGTLPLAFVVGKDVMVHLNVIDVFEKADITTIKPKHFATEKEARDWLDEVPQKKPENSKIKISFNGVDKDGDSIIELKRPSNDITNTIKSFKNLIEENEFIKSNIDKYTSLTKREREILLHYSKNKTHQTISDELFISLLTVRSHWKSIKRKLHIQSFHDVVMYVEAFNLNNLKN